MRYQQGYIKLALPKGRFLPSTANLLKEIALNFEGYSNKARQYRLRSEEIPYLSAKVFQERDIPIQVAIGNYDLGICGLDWIEELRVRYPASSLVEISSLNHGGGNIYAAVSNQVAASSVDELLAGQSSWRMVSEYPNLAQALALNLRLKDFKVFPVWGAAEAYPPENADVAVLWARSRKEVEAHGLVAIMRLLPVDAFLIANREKLESKNLSQILDRFGPVLASRPVILRHDKLDIRGKCAASPSPGQEKDVKLALPDGHQRIPTSDFLEQAGFKIDGYSGEPLNRRPSADLDWLGVKVIRPQDMPLQVANGNFDLAITGKDWLLEHLYRFPLSPVVELLDLGFGEVRIVAALGEDMPVDNADDLRVLVQSGKLNPFRVASEYINIADKYLRDNHISSYKLIPTSGASEAFLPEDADLLIDNTQTGKTLAQHKLKVIDDLLSSTACLIGNKDSTASPAREEKIEFIVRALRGGLW